MTYKPITDGKTRTGRAPNPGHGGGQVPEGTSTSQVRTGRAPNPGHGGGSLPDRDTGSGYTSRSTKNPPAVTHVDTDAKTIRNP